MTEEKFAIHVHLRSSTMNIKEALRREMVEQQPQTSTLRLSASAFSPFMSVIVHYPNIIELVNRGCREVPHELIMDQQQRRVDTCTNQLENHTDSHF